ncbi:MAG: hypothetical protein K2N38_10460 [Oscillospiraceae bacterium]|nr:hypothetical protein [Oscillospiraceae bacterium]
MIKDTRRSEELFEALGDLDDDVIADAKHISSYGENVVVVKRTPLWKTIAGWGAAAACLAVLAVGGIFGFKYISGRNAVTPPAPGASDGTSIWVSDCHAYDPPTFPEEAKYVYTGDYSELENCRYGETIEREVYEDIIALEERSDLIVIGEFTDDPHQYVDPEGRFVASSWKDECSCNIFKIDKVVKGRCFEGEEILISQNGFVSENKFYQLSNLTPMLKGDKWIYFLRKDDGGYSPLGDSDGRYPVPGSEHEFVLNDNVYGVFDTNEFRSEVYEEIKKRLPDWKYEGYFESEYPEEAKYVFMGDYGELDHVGIQGDRDVYSSYEQLADISDLIVSGKFTDIAHQTAPIEPTEGFDFGDKHRSYNTFYIDKVIKGDKKTGDSIIISQPDIVYDGKILFYQMSPMICGDRWVYFLEERDGYYYAINEMQGRYPLPDSNNKVLKDCGKYGYYGNPIPYEDKVYAELVETLETFEHTVSKNFDGVILTVKMKKDIFVPDEDIWVKTTVRNTTDKPIGLLMPVQGEGSHTEVSTQITNGSSSLVDVDVYGKEFDDALDSHIIEPGEEYVQEMTFRAVIMNMIDSVPSNFEFGEFKGTATIKLLSDPNDVNSEVTEHSVEFSLTIEGKNSDTQTAPDDSAGITKVFECGKSEEEQWTMEEFPDVTFRCDSNSVSVLSERNIGVPEGPMYDSLMYNSYMLYMGMPVFDVYLVDLNGDGMREIVSTVAYGSGMIDVHIEAFDYANCIGYTLWDRCNYDYMLDSGSGGLTVRKFVYMENDIVSEQPLTLDMMTANDSEVVFKGSEPTEWTMDEFPGTTFSADSTAVYAEKDGVKNVIISNAARLLCVKLTDNDGDGKRDIACEFTDETGTMRLISVHYANGLLLNYSGNAVDTDEIIIPDEEQ